jgi:hypothetical protein
METSQLPLCWNRKVRQGREYRSYGEGHGSRWAAAGWSPTSSHFAKQLANTFAEREYRASEVTKLE